MRRWRNTAAMAHPRRNASERRQRRSRNREIDLVWRQLQHIPVERLDNVLPDALAKCGTVGGRCPDNCRRAGDDRYLGRLHPRHQKSARLRAALVRGRTASQTATPVIARQGPAWAIVDGNSAIGMVTSVFAMQTAISKAKACGVGYVGVKNSCHFGAAGYYAHLAAREGLIGIAMANDIPSVTAPGARGAITGSNPLAYAVPAGSEPPIMLDMAISTVAGGKVYAAHALGQPIPDNWIVGADGRPTTDSSAYPFRGALMPMAGHKGYGLALLIETLSVRAFRCFDHLADQELDGQRWQPTDRTRGRVSGDRRGDHHAAGRIRRTHRRPDS